MAKDKIQQHERINRTRLGCLKWRLFPPGLCARQLQVYSVTAGSDGLLLCLRLLWEWGCQRTRCLCLYVITFFITAIWCKVGVSGGRLAVLYILLITGSGPRTLKCLGVWFGWLDWEESASPPPSGWAQKAPTFVCFFSGGRWRMEGGGWRRSISYQCFISVCL